MGKGKIVCPRTEGCGYGTMMKERCFNVHWAWIVLGSCFITFFVNYSIRIGAYSVLLPEMIKDLGINMTQAGMIRSAYFLTYIFFSPFMGWLTDHIGGRFIISDLRDLEKRVRENRRVGRMAPHGNEAGRSISRYQVVQFSQT